MAIQRPLFVIPKALTGLQCSSADRGHPVYNLAHFDAIGLTWKTDNPSEIWLRGQFDGSQAIDFISLVSANAQAGTQIRVRLGTSQAEVDGTAPYDSGAIPFINPAITREDGLYHSHLELPSVQSASWFRIDITGHTGNFEAAMLVCGVGARPSRFYNTDIQFGIEDLGEAEFSPYGVLDEQEGVIFRTTSFTLGWQSRDEFFDTFQPMMEKLGLRGIIYCCVDPEATIHRQAKTYMGIFEKAPFARGTRYPGFTQDFSIISMI